jgi:catechol 2,3-dioxygenase-like lactoylglutathione lyase family enzyme
MLRDLHHPSLFVTNLDRSLAFYCGTLGLELVGRHDDWGGPFLGTVCGLPGVDLRINIAIVRVAGSAKILELIQVLAPAGEPTDASARGRGIARIGFEVDAIEATVADLRRKGVHFLSDIVTVQVAPNAHYSDGKAIKFLDPDGIVLELQQPPAPGRIT